jgi:hypothetical protein
MRAVKIAAFLLLAALPVTVPSTVALFGLRHSHT